MSEDAKMEGKSEIAEYSLPICDVSKERRNFPGYEKGSWYSLSELQAGEVGGVTDTDSQTESTNDAGASTINKKHGKPGRSWKSSSKRSKDN